MAAKFSLRRYTIPKHALSMDMEVPFHDIDALRIVWHGNYLKYLEISRCALLRKYGLDAADMINLGYKFMVGDLSCRYANAMTYGDRFRITSWFTETEHRIGIAYEIMNLTTGKKAFTAVTNLITVSDEGKLQISTPRALLQRLPPIDS